MPGEEDESGMAEGRKRNGEGGGGGKESKRRQGLGQGQFAGAVRLVALSLPPSRAATPCLPAALPAVSAPSTSSLLNEPARHQCSHAVRCPTRGSPPSGERSRKDLAEIQERPRCHQLHIQWRGPARRLPQYRNSRQIQRMCPFPAHHSNAVSVRHRRTSALTWAGCWYRPGEELCCVGCWWWW